MTSLQKFNQLVIQEDIVYGERTRAYRVDALTNGQWKEIVRGQSIGHKRIHLIDEVEASRLRLVIDESIAEPIIEQFSIYNIGD